MLNVVLAGTNQSKADDGPDKWRPASEAAWCAYAIDWVLVKWRRGLEVTADEVVAVLIRRRESVRLVHRTETTLQRAARSTATEPDCLAG